MERLLLGKSWKGGVRRDVRLTSSLVLCRDIQDAIGVNIKDNVDLRHATRSRRDAAELKLAEQVIVLGAGALSLEDLNEHARLVVGVGGEDLLLLGGDGGIPGDQGGLQGMHAVRLLTALYIRSERCGRAACRNDWRSPDILQAEL